MSDSEAGNEAHWKDEELTTVLCFARTDVAEHPAAKELTKNTAVVVLGE